VREVDEGNGTDLKQLDSDLLASTNAFAHICACDFKIVIISFSHFLRLLIHRCATQLGFLINIWWKLIGALRSKRYKGWYHAVCSFFDFDHTIEFFQVR
jgi:hypothetical protein